ncbi:MAG: thioredoxin family protein [Candidatus Hydrogenedentes bacterium]|nr:thioredoxin family protein [Candidatus Hydrogenedentota bacterium]
MPLRARQVLIAFVALAFSPGCAVIGDKAPPLDWKATLPAAISAAQSASRPILVLAGAAWCPSCRRLEKETLAHPATRALLNDFVLLRVDVDESLALAERFGAGMVPTLVILDSAGKVLLANVGFQERTAFAQFLEQGAALAAAGPEHPRNTAPGPSLPQDLS